MGGEVAGLPPHPERMVAAAKNRSARCLWTVTRPPVSSGPEILG